MKRDLIFEVVYPHSPEHVWRALTDPAAMAEWLMPNDFKPQVGHRFQFRTKPAPGFDGIVHCEVLELEPPRKLAYSWRGGPVNTVVTFFLTPVPEGTRLRLEQRGFQGLNAWIVSFILGGGWKKIVNQHLPSVLRRLTDGGLLPRNANDPEQCR